MEFMAVWEVAVVICVALVICSLSTSLAMESAALFVPTFVIFLPAVLPTFPAFGVNEAIGVTLVVMFFGQTSAISGYLYRRQVLIPLATRAVLFSIPVAIVGRIVSYWLPEAFLLLAFAGLLVTLSIVILHTSHVDGEEPRGTATISPLTGVQLTTRDRLVMGCGGGVTGLVGLGIGEVSNTLLNTQNDVPVRLSIGTSTLILYLTVLSATITNLVLTYAGGTIGIEPSIPWEIVLIVAPTVLVGGQLGPYINSRMPESLTVRVLIVLYLVVACVTVLRVIA